MSDRPATLSLQRVELEDPQPELTVQCPSCMARRGTPCRSLLTGRPRPSGRSHLGRIDAHELATGASA